ncbi:MAG: HAMP domain-containing histidine kinase [Elusimicrobia bacterium]|nr:HAMP domain-containing histidine kinase [Elusimicrobiota bacterium]
MAPHPERKPSSPSLHPRVARRGPSAGTPTPVKHWRTIPDPRDAMNHTPMPPRRFPRNSSAPFLSEPMTLGSPVLAPEGLPFSILEEPTRNLEDVGRGVAHKLRSGLCALNGGLQMSLQQMLPGPTREMLALAERGAHHITEIVKDLVLLTQRPAFHPRPLDVNLLLGEFLNGLRRQPEWEGVTITRSLDGSLPMILGDPDLLDTVFDAVAKNAVDAMTPRITPPPEPTSVEAPCSSPLQSDEDSQRPNSEKVALRHLAVETSREDDNIVVRMTDSGAGLTPDTMELAFQPYFSTKSGRRGMGLPLARWLVHVHGGSMSLRSRPHTGTTVTFRFPDPTALAPDIPALH